MHNALSLRGEGVTIVEAVDHDPKKTGKDLGDLSGIISTQSSLQKVESQIKEAAAHNLDIVSTYVITNQTHSV